MTDNEATLNFGVKIAKENIARDMLNKVLIPLAKRILKDAYQKRAVQGNNMTGNTINAYAVGVYVQGQLAWIETSSQSLPQPLRRKLGQGERFYAGSQRWDGDIQTETFTGRVSTNGATEADQSIAFLHEYNANPKGWVIVVCNGVEYATYQESQMNIDTLTESFLDASSYAPPIQSF
jgi:hypothetical protein